MTTTLAIAVDEISRVAEVQREAAGLAGRLGLGETVTGKVALVATEMARNLVLHATGERQLLLRPLECPGVLGVELLALDRSPGMVDVAASLRDGYSTSGTAGTGLGAILRLATVHDLYSNPEVGTALLAQVWAPGGRVCGPEVGAVSLPKPGQVTNGDGWSVLRGRDVARLLVVDGLGHGPDAAEASQVALKAAAELPGLRPEALLQLLHEALRSTRGAAAAVAELDEINDAIRYAGVGNIAGVIAAPEGGRQAMVSHNGALGAQVRRMHEFTYPWPKGALAILHSDGLSGRWDLKSYPGLASRHPSLIAGVLWRDFARGTDDVTVVVARNTATRSEQAEAA